jgi:hypothetical protein
MRRRDSRMFLDAAVLRERVACITHGQRLVSYQVYRYGLACGCTAGAPTPVHEVSSMLHPVSKH